MTWDVGALLLGLIVVIGLALLASPLAERDDEAMVWEGRVAVGFTAMAFVGPFWLAQGIVTLTATFADGGVRPGWLWAWFVAAPVLGASHPVAALARVAQRALPRRSPSAYSSRGVAAVQQEANFAWATTEAEPGWELRRTPPLPESWPPRDGGSAVWLCYAERPGATGSVEVTAPWARITLAPGPSGWPVVERLSDTVESIGLQPVPPEPTPPGPLLDAMHRGDPTGRVAKDLGEWRSRNGLVAAHPAVAVHLPPA